VLVDLLLGEMIVLVGQRQRIGQQVGIVDIGYFLQEISIAGEFVVPWRNKTE
jgi:hypothetical protein